MPPFPYVRECLERFKGRADMIVCSQTPCAALEAEWNEHDLAKYVVAICGQEVASKKESLAAAKQYPPNHTLMIGDAPGDYKAAVANDCLFFPSIQAPRKQVGDGSRRRDRPHLRGSFAVHTRISCSKSSTYSCPSGHHGKLKTKKATRRHEKTQKRFFVTFCVFCG